MRIFLAKVAFAFRAYGLVDLFLWRPIGECEFAAAHKQLNDLDRIKLHKCYMLLARTHLIQGDVENAAQVVIRANRFLGVDQLPGLRINIKAAHIIRAGFAATRLLEEGGLATLMIQNGEEPTVSSNKPVKNKTENVITFPGKKS